MKLLCNLSDDHHPAPTFTPPELPKRVHVRGVTAGKRIFKNKQKTKKQSNTLNHPYILKIIYQVIHTKHLHAYTHISATDRIFTILCLSFNFWPDFRSIFVHPNFCFPFVPSSIYHGFYSVDLSVFYVCPPHPSPHATSTIWHSHNQFSTHTCPTFWLVLLYFFYRFLKYFCYCCLLAASKMISFFRFTHFLCASRFFSTKRFKSIVLNPSSIIETPTTVKKTSFFFFVGPFCFTTYANDRQSKSNQKPIMKFCMWNFIQVPIHP